MENCKRKIIQVKLETVDPTGFIEESKSFEMEVIDDKECMKVDRLVLHVGDCLYRIDNKGFIIERLIPHK